MKMEWHKFHWYFTITLNSFLTKGTRALNNAVYNESAVTGAAAFFVVFCKNQV